MEVAVDGMVLVVGASGLLGSAAIRRFAEDGYRVLAMSRRTPDAEGAEFEHLPADLGDPAAVAAALRGRRISHVVYAAAYERAGLVGGWSDPVQMETNRRMLGAVLDALAAHPPSHISIMQGTKAYGVHLHPIPLPARERFPRDDHANFYWLQEDLLREWAARTGSGWTIFRPVQVVGPAYGVAYSTPPVIGAYAAIARETGEPFAFPGRRLAPVQAVDAELVADALAWAAGAPEARGEHFNLTNGEVFSWAEMWPVFADVFGIEAAAPEPRRLAEYLPSHAATWQRIVERHGLRPLALDEVLGKSHQYADYTFGADLTEPAPPALVSTVKVKLAGFGGVRDTEEMFRRVIGTLADRRIIPR